MIRKYFQGLLIGIVVLTLIVSGSVGPAAQEKKVQAIIVFKDKPGQQERQYIEGQGGAVTYQYTLINGMAVELPQHVYEKLVFMQKHPDDLSNQAITEKIKYVELDQEMHIAVKPSKPTPTPAPGQTTPWGVARICAPDSWIRSTGEGVKVAVLDTGIDYNHPDLKNNVKGGVSFVIGARSYKDDNGHGTHCAGIIAAENNGIGVVGVAPGASLYAVKVLSKTGSGTTSNVIKGIDWAVNNGMQVISMSLGGGDSQALHDACDYAYSKGIVLVAAAGNDYGGSIIYPAGYDSVIAVTATDSSDGIASFSNVGSAAELAAPGVSILSTYKDSGYATLSGTSMATPHVAGTAALLFAMGISDPAEVRAQLDNTVNDLGVEGRDYYYGYGLVNASEATA
jgi:subtilisin